MLKLGTDALVLGGVTAYKSLRLCNKSDLESADEINIDGFSAILLIRNQHVINLVQK